jgi:hypothetical protein
MCKEAEKMAMKTHLKMWWVISAVLLAGLSGSVLAGTYSGGTGEPDNPYRIATPNDLNDIGNHVEDFNKCFILVNDINLADYTSTQFNIIGDSSNPFTGVFDGNGHTISHFTYEPDRITSIGLFRCLDDPNAEIKNLTLSEPNVDAGIGRDVGSLVCSLRNGMIQNCSVQGGSVSGNWSVGSVGGLVGSNRGTITNCYSAGSVSGSLSVGGLVGCNRGTITNCYSYSAGSVSGDVSFVGGLVGDNRGTISNCYSAGSVSGDGSFVGGLAGVNTGTIFDCYATGEVSGTDSQTGGLVGFGGCVVNSFWDIETSSQSSSAGGKGRTTSQMKTANTFIGWGGCGNEGIWTIDEGNDYPRLAWEGRPGQPLPEQQLADFVTGAGTDSDPYLICTAEQLNLVGLFICEWEKHYKLVADIDLADYTGAEFNIVGSTEILFTGVFDGDRHTISNFTYTAPRADFVGLFSHVGSGGQVKNLSIVDGDVAGRRYVGGLAGYSLKGNITDCSMLGTVSGDSGCIGGLVGLNNGMVSNCYTTTEVSGDYSGSCVGGIVGWNGGTIWNCHALAEVSGHLSVGGLVGDNDGTISNGCAMAEVSGKGTVGGLVGSNDGTVTNCYAKAEVLARGYDAGGLVGVITYHASVSNCYATGKVCGAGRVGGLVGANAHTIWNCYSTAEVSGGSYVGGLVGKNWYGTTTNSFWDIDTSDCNSSAGGTGMTTAEMNMESTFTDAGWDFVGETANGNDDIWTIHEGEDYPKHVWKLVNFIGWYEVDFLDYAFFADRWQDINCGDANDCDGADLDFSDAVDWADLKIFFDHWLAGL